MKFKVDENLPEQVADFLRGHGHDAHTVHDERIAGTDDQSIYNICQRESRILITLDLDFADMRRYPPAGGPGMIILRLANQRRDYVLAFMPRIARLLEMESIDGSLCVADEVRTRIRTTYP